MGSMVQRRQNVVARFVGGPIGGELRSLPATTSRHSYRVAMPPRWVDVVVPTRGTLRTYRYVRTTPSSLGGDAAWLYTVKGQPTFEVL